MPPGEGGSNDGGNGASPDAKKEPAAHGRRYQQRNGYQKPIVLRQPKFEGKCEALKGHIYNCSDSRQADQYTKTTKELAEYVGRDFKDHPGDIRLVVEHLMYPT